jgi:hypothetical protein
VSAPGGGLLSALAQLDAVVQVGAPHSFRFALHMLCLLYEHLDGLRMHRLGKAEARMHLVEGLLSALAQLDAVVQVCVRALSFLGQYRRPELSTFMA